MLDWQELPLTQGERCLLSAPDVLAVSCDKWFMARNGRRKYALTNVCVNGVKRTLTMHRRIMNPAPGEEVDHINGDGLDNRRENLRLVTHAQNQQAFQRKRLGCHSSYRGVTWDRSRGLWMAKIKIRSSTINLGRFVSQVEAALAYNRAAQEAFGDFANLNTF